MTETLGIYIQVPFCASKCSFCNFSSRVERPREFDAYCDALAAEIDRLPHTAGETRELVLQARRAACQNINLDLVAGLPHQTEATWRESLSTALDLRPQHLSVYLFEIDEKSRLGREVLNGGTRYGAATVPD